MTFIATTPLISVVDADSYFSEQLNSDAWTDSTSATKLKALITSTKAIDNLNFDGIVNDDNQLHAFPRDGASTTPVLIQWACAENALALLKDSDPEIEYANLRKTSDQFSTVRASYDSTILPEHIVAGILSIVAWRFLKPYMSFGDSTLVLDRV